MITIPASYEESRLRFRNDLAVIQSLWPAARLGSHSLPGGEHLSIDWISADALQAKQRLFILTTGEHGIEGYVGSAMLQLFVQEFVPRLDPQTTGLLLVHVINPWGMKHHHRVNANNVDLNRNFLDLGFETMAGSNPDYPALAGFLNPDRPLISPFWSTVWFTGRLIKNMAAFGVSRIREASLMGQYRYPTGMYFGGQELQEETRVMMDLTRATLSGYGQLVHLDMHSGYGPRLEMSLVNSPLEKQAAEEIRAKYGVRRVVAANPEEFYSIHGDMIDWEYALIKKEFPHMHHFSTTFEFGTFGESLLAGIRSLRSTIFRNRVNLHGAGPSAGRWMDHEYEEHYCPPEPAWFSKIQVDARQAFEGILKAEGYIE
jgi:hypothetical protein